MWRTIFILGLAALVAWAPAAYAEAKDGKTENTIEHGGQEREYLLYKPENLPSLIELHQFLVR